MGARLGPDRGPARWAPGLATAGSTPRRQRQVGAASFTNLPRGWPLYQPGGALYLSALDDHLAAPRGRGRLADARHTGAAGGAICGDLVRISVKLEGERVADA